MIIDPYPRGVYIWTDSNVTSIKGNVFDICKEIYSRVVQPRQTVGGRVIYDQIYDLHIDITGIGREYGDCLTDMGLEIHEIRHREIDTVLPIRCPGTPCRYVEKVMDKKPVLF